MKIEKVNSLVELFFKKYEEQCSADFKKINEKIFLVSLKNKGLYGKNSGTFSYSWENIYKKIVTLSNYLKKLLLKVINVSYCQKIDLNG